MSLLGKISCVEKGICFVLKTNNYKEKIDTPRS